MHEGATNSTVQVSFRVQGISAPPAANAAAAVAYESSVSAAAGISGKTNGRTRTAMAAMTAMLLLIVFALLKSQDRSGMIEEHSHALKLEGDLPRREGGRRD